MVANSIISYCFEVALYLSLLPPKTQLTGGPHILLSPVWMLDRGFLQSKGRGVSPEARKRPADPHVHLFRTNPHECNGPQVQNTRSNEYTFAWLQLFLEFFSYILPPPPVWVPPVRAARGRPGCVDRRGVSQTPVVDSGGFCQLLQFFKFIFWALIFQIESKCKANFKVCGVLLFLMLISRHPCKTQCSADPVDFFDQFFLLQQGEYSKE